MDSDPRDNSVMVQIEALPAVEVPIASLLPADTPRRRGEDEDHIENLRHRVTELPPLLVHRATMRVIDGMHRLEVAVREGAESVRVRFFDGDDRDCFPLAVQLNIAHGLPLTSTDRVAAAARIVRSHPDWSDRAVAALAGVSPKTVAAHRSTADIPQSNARIGQDGRVRSTDTTERRRRAADYLAERPEASLREVARESGLSVGTARDVRMRMQAGRDPVRVGRSGAAEGTGPNALPGAATPFTPITPLTLPVGTGTQQIVDELRLDPTIRMTDAGRLLLRIFEANRALAGCSARLAATLPGHCAQSVALVARRFSQTWCRFAEEVEQGIAAPPVV